MILETLRLLTDALNDGTTGVNIYLATIPTSGGDAVPTPLALIVDRTRHFSAAIGRLPDEAASYPCLLISQPGGGNEIDPHVHAGPIRDGHVQVVIRYGALESAAAKAVRDGYYTLRALEKSITSWLNGPEAARTSNSVVVYKCDQTSVYDVWEPVDDKVVAGAMALTFTVRDMAP